MTQPRLLITGAKGFIGAQVYNNLRNYYDVHAVSRSRFQSTTTTWHDADLTKSKVCEELIRDIRPTHLIHCAWETQHGTFWEATTNEKWLEAGKSLFSAFQQCGGYRIIGIGTCAEYAESEKPLKETDDTQIPSTLYGRTKRDLFLFTRKLSISFAWARVFHPYGIGEGPTRFVPSVCQSLLRAEPAKCSSGQQIRNFIDVRELGAAIAQLVSSDVENAINIGQPKSLTIGTVALMLGEIANQPSLIKLSALPDRANEPRILIPDLTRQITELSYHPSIATRDGLSVAYRWWESKLS